jgi:hypothetical protein
MRDDLLIQSDLDEIPLPSALKTIFQNPPQHSIAITSYMFCYSLRWRYKKKWIGNVVIRHGAIHQPCNNYRHKRNPMQPDLGAVHCRYCFPHLKDIILKLQTSAHIKYDHGRYVDPNLIAASVFCDRSPFQPHLDLFDFGPKSPYKFNLSAKAERFLWQSLLWIWMIST